MAHNLLRPLVTHPDSIRLLAVRLSAEEPTAGDCQRGHTALIVIRRYPVTASCSLRQNRWLPLSSVIAGCASPFSTPASVAPAAENANPCLSAGTRSRRCRVDERSNDGSQRIGQPVADV